MADGQQISIDPVDKLAKLIALLNTPKISELSRKL